MANYYWQEHGKLCHIGTSEFDEDKYPIPPAPIEPSKTECRHTPMPDGYNERIEWMDRASETHEQIACLHCGKWAIWLPKEQARVINERHEKECAEFMEGFELAEAKRNLSNAKARLRKAKRKNVD